MARQTETLYGPLDERVVVVVRLMIAEAASSPLLVLADFHHRLGIAQTSIGVAPAESPMDRWSRLMGELFPLPTSASEHAELDTVAPTHIASLMADLTDGELRTVTRILVAVSTFIDGEALDLYEQTDVAVAVNARVVPDGWKDELAEVFRVAETLRDAYEPEVLASLVGTFAARLQQQADVPDAAHDQTPAPDTTTVTSYEVERARAVVDWRRPRSAHAFLFQLMMQWSMMQWLQERESLRPASWFAVRPQERESRRLASWFADSEFRSPDTPAAAVVLLTTRPAWSDKTVSLLAELLGAKAVGSAVHPRSRDQSPTAVLVAPDGSSWSRPLSVLPECGPPDETFRGRSTYWYQLWSCDLFTVRSPFERQFRATADDMCAHVSRPSFAALRLGTSAWWTNAVDVLDTAMQGLESRHLVVVIDGPPGTAEQRRFGGLQAPPMFKLKDGVGNRRLPALAGRSVTVMYRPFGDVDRSATTAHSQAWIDLCMASGAASFELLIDNSSSTDHPGPEGDDEPYQQPDTGQATAPRLPGPPGSAPASSMWPLTNDVGGKPPQPPSTTRSGLPRTVGWSRVRRVCRRARPTRRCTALALALVLGAIALLVAAVSVLALITRRVIDQRWAGAGLGAALLVAALSTWWWWAIRRDGRGANGRLASRGWFSSACDNDVVQVIDVSSLAGELPQCV